MRAGAGVGVQSRGVDACYLNLHYFKDINAAKCIGMSRRPREWNYSRLFAKSSQRVLIKGDRHPPPTSTITYQLCQSTNLPSMYKYRSQRKDRSYNCKGVKWFHRHIVWQRYHSEQGYHTTFYTYCQRNVNYPIRAYDKEWAKLSNRRSTRR